MRKRQDFKNVLLIRVGDRKEPGSVTVLVNTDRVLLVSTAVLATCWKYKDFWGRTIRKVMEGGREAGGI